MKVKLTPTQSEWQKQIKRLQRIIRTEERKGLTIPAGIIPEQPKHVTKQKIEQLRSIKPATIRAVLKEQALSSTPSTPVDILGRVRTKHEEEYIRHPRFSTAGEPEYVSHPLTPEERSAIAKKAWQTRYANGFQKKPPSKRPYEAHPLTPEQRSEQARKAWEKRKAEGFTPKPKKPYEPHPLTPEQRSANAKKAMATRMARGFKPSFGTRTPEQRSASAKKAMATRMAKGFKPTFGKLTPEQRSINAKKAWATRYEKGFKKKVREPHPLTPEQRSANAKKAWETRKKKQAEKPVPQHELPPPRKEYPDTAPSIEDTWVEIMDSIINNIDYPSLREYYHNLVRDVYNSADDDTLANIINQEAYMVDKVSRINYESAVDDKLDASVALYYVITGEQASTEIYTRMRDDIKYDMTMLGEYITHT